MKKRLISSLLVLFIALQIIACRFTVREIGFSTLSRDFYSLVFIDSDLNPASTAIVGLRNHLKDSNIGLIIINPSTDQTHPALLAAKQANIQFPAIILLSPDGRILLVEQADLKEIADEILSSPLRLQFVNNFYNSFAYTVLIEGKNSVRNTQAEEILEKACRDISNRIPNMPKQVRNGASVLKISSSDFDNEKIFLWSLGINEIPESPLALVIYGRGRIIGDVLNFKDISDNLAFKYMAMIGADCECGLDREWMLGDQIPLDWSTSTRQLLTNELGFDVDNPMILAEMSHILSKERVEGLNTTLSFAPEEIDLDDFFSTSKKSLQPESPEAQSQPYNPLYFILILTLIILITGGILFHRRKK